MFEIDGAEESSSTIDKYLIEDGEAEDKVADKDQAAEQCNNNEESLKPTKQELYLNDLQSIDKLYQEIEDQIQYVASKEGKKIC